ncbi:MAG: hypothetical protein AAB296_05370, partial [Candidatus Desantisbacteria bacterium]
GEVRIDFGKDQTISTATLFQEGTFSITFLISTQGYGSITITGIDENGNNATTVFFILPKIAILSPPSGPVGASLFILGAGFKNDYIVIAFEGALSPPLGSATTDGTFTIDFVIETNTYGTKVITAFNTPDTYILATTTFFITPHIYTLIPTKGAIGQLVTIKGSGFRTVELITISFGTTKTIATTTSLADGLFSATFSVNTQDTSNIVITTSHNQQIFATTLFSFLPKITLVNPTKGVVGSWVTIVGRDFSEVGSITIGFGINLTITTTISSTKGTFSITFLVDTQPGRTVTITARGANGEQAFSQFYIMANITKILPEDGRCKNINFYIYSTGFGGMETLILFFGNNFFIYAAESDGRFEQSFTPDYRPAGTITVTVVPNSELSNPIHFATITYCVRSGIDITPETGKVGTMVTVKGDGFGASEVVHILFGTHQTLTTVITDGKGSFTGTFIVQTAPLGNNPITAKGVGSGFVGTAFFFVLPEILSIKPISGSVYDVVSVFGRGYGSGSLIGVHFGITQTIATGISGVDGLLLATFIVDTKPSGTYTITASDALGYEATTEFIILPSVNLLPSSGYVGTNIEVFGFGFATHREVIIDFGTSETIASNSSGDFGTFSVSFIIDTQVYGSQVVTARDKNNPSSFATKVFFILPKISLLLPSEGNVGEVVSIEGTGFSGGIVRIDFGSTLS